METQITLSEASAKLTQLCEKVVGDRDVVIIQRPDGENVALIAADELDSLMETVHLLRSPANPEPEKIVLSDRDWEIVTSALENPPEPNEALKAAIKEHQKKYGKW